jgi:hypothetical protein
VARLIAGKLIARAQAEAPKADEQPYVEYADGKGGRHRVRLDESVEDQRRLPGRNKLRHDAEKLWTHEGRD